MELDDHQDNLFRDLNELRVEESSMHPTAINSGMEVLHSHAGVTSINIKTEEDSFFQLQPKETLKSYTLKSLMTPSQQQASFPMALVAGTGRLPEDQRIFHHCDGNLNFSTAHNDDDEFGHRKKQSRDPLSHRVIEKRRRDRMNNCLADLSRLIPADYIKRGRGRVEKTEIIEMAIKHMQYLQTRVDLVVQHNGDPAQPALGLTGDLRVAKCEQSPCSDRGDSVSFQSLPETAPPALEGIPQAVARPIVNIEHYRFGYEECATVAIDFLVEREGLQHNEGLCSRLSKHLEKHREKLVSGDSINFPRSRQPGEATSSSGSSSSCGGGATSGSGAAADPQTQTQAQASASQLRDRLSCASPPLDHRGQHYECPSCVDPEAPDAHGVQEGLEIEHEGPEGGRHSFPDSTQNSYKFKTCINKRFSEEHNNGSLPKRRRSSPQSPLATPSTPSQPSSQQTLSPSASVPVFVWHTKGAFYIP